VASPPLKDLITALRRWQPGAVAFSGGVDSTLLLHLARQAWDRPPLAVCIVSPLLTDEEKNRAQETAGSLGIPLKKIAGREYLLPEFIENPPNRCYYCKRYRFRLARRLLESKGIPYLLDGTNADDLRDYRPGLRANRELKIVSPFALLGWSKEKIRRTSRRLGLPTWDQPSSACLATRIPFGTPITKKQLTRIGRAEAALRSLGFRECRLRVHGPIARIEVREKDFPQVMNKRTRAALEQTLKALGFTYITLDLQGLRSGSMNAVLTKNSGNILAF
jgi:pyridinium-3,5-biscarboxylic acid mononucleotide sulfurtransferase